MIKITLHNVRKILGCCRSPRLSDTRSPRSSDARSPRTSTVEPPRIQLSDSLHTESETDTSEADLMKESTDSLQDQEGM